MSPRLLDVDLRPATPADEPFLDDLFVQARPDLQLLAQLDPALIAMQRRAQQSHYAARWPRHHCYVACRAGEPVAMVAVDDEAEPTHVLDIAVRAQSRGVGIGTAVLTRVVEESRGPVELTVAIGNPARRLYARLGFVEVGHTDTDLVLRREPQPPAVSAERGRTT